MKTVCNVETVYVGIKEDYQKGALGKTWLYEGKNPLPASVKVKEASEVLNFTLARDKEAIIRERKTRKLLMVVLRDRVRPDVLEHLNATNLEMFENHRPVAHPEGSFGQGFLAAAGYLSTRQCGIFTHVLNLPKNLRGTDFQDQHEAKVTTANALLFNYAMGLFPHEVTDNINKVLEENNLPRLDGNKYGAQTEGFTVSFMEKEIVLNHPLELCKAYAAQNYAKYNHTDNNFLDFAIACCSRRGIYKQTHNNQWKIEEGNFEGGNFFLTKWGIKIEMATNTLFCWPEEEEHGTTAIPRGGYQTGWSQNLSKRTVTAVKKWRQGTEVPARFNYRAEAIKKDTKAKEALNRAVQTNIKTTMDQVQVVIEENSINGEIEEEITREFMQLRYGRYKWA